MERLIRNLTKKYTSLLPDGTAFFTPDDLRKLDIPEFVIQRIEIEIYRNLNDSIVPPDSEWADMTASEVEHAWEMFINAIVAEVRMPAAYASSVFETSIADVIEMILQPRKSIPGILFGPDRELSRSEILKRRKFITVHSHLADAVIRYMDRKEKDRITRDQCHKIVEVVDDRLTQNYNSLNWAQLLQPLFLLSGPKVDSENLRIFFEDRGLNKFARRFDMTADPVDKTAFIEILSSPDLLNEESDEDEPSTRFDMYSPKEKPKDEREPQSDSPSLGIDFGDSKEEESERSVTEKKESAPESTEAPEEVEKEKEVHFTEEEQTDLDKPEEDTLLSSFQSKRRESHIEDEPLHSNRFIYDAEEEEEDENDFTKEISEEEGETLFGRFFAGEDEEPQEEDGENLGTIFGKQSEEIEKGKDTSEQKRPKEEPKTEGADRSKPKEKSKSWIEDQDSYQEADDDISEEEKLKNIFPDEDSEADDKPIWQSFLGEEGHIDEGDIEEAEYSSFSELDEYEEGEPLIDLGGKRDEKNGEEEKLIGWMANDENRFTNSIFSGSDRAYEQALMELNELDSWKQASKYIENEIFARNFVDMYDEDAVDFTDRLQTYFDQHKS